MAMDPINFLHSVLLQVEALTGMIYQQAEGRDLWRGQVDEAGAGGAGSAAPYTQAILYPSGPRRAGANGAEMASVQWVTIGLHDGALRNAQAVFEALCNADGTSRLNWVIPGATSLAAADGSWRIIAIDHLQRPGVLGAAGDESQSRGRVRVVFNSDITFTRPAT